MAQTSKSGRVPSKLGRNSKTLLWSPGSGLPTVVSANLSSIVVCWGIATWIGTGGLHLLGLSTFCIGGPMMMR